MNRTVSKNIFWMMILAAFAVSGILSSHKIDNRIWKSAKNIFHKKTAINKDSEAIFSDDAALKDFIEAYGLKQTTTHLNELSAKFGSCHNTAHRAGRIGYEVYKEKAFKECGAECHSGCYHGATEAFFKENGTAHLSEELNVICSSELNPFFSHQCLHGIGHGLTAWTSYDLPEALKSCDLLERGQDSCWTGVFMENIVGALAPGQTGAAGDSGHVSKYLNDDPNFPCDSPNIDEKYRSSCYFLQTDRMLQLFGGDFKKVAAGCAAVPAQHRRVCFESMGRDVGGANPGRPEGAIAACKYAPAGDYRIGCLIGAAQDTFWDPTGQDAGLAFCGALTVKAEKDACYSIIFSRAPEVLASKTGQNSFCDKVESGYRDSCRSFIR